MSERGLGAALARPVAIRGLESGAKDPALPLSRPFDTSPAVSTPACTVDPPRSPGTIMSQFVSLYGRQRREAADPEGLMTRKTVREAATSIRGATNGLQGRSHGRRGESESLRPTVWQRAELSVSRALRPPPRPIGREQTPGMSTPPRRPGTYRDTGGTGSLAHPPLSIRTIVSAGTQSAWSRQGADAHGLLRPAQRQWRTYSAIAGGLPAGSEQALAQLCQRGVAELTQLLRLRSQLGSIRVDLLLQRAAGLAERAGADRGATAL